MRITAFIAVKKWIDSTEIEYDDIKIFPFDELKEKYIEWAHKNEMPAYSLPVFTIALKKFCADNEIIRITKEPTKNKTRREIFALDKYKKYNSSIEEKFEQISNITRMVAYGYYPFGIILGGPRIGKTYTILETLKADDEKFLNFTGVINNSFHLYKTLHENKNGIIVFDDSKSILQDMKCIDILLSAFDNYENKSISYSGHEINRRIYKNLPQNFIYKGGSIFIANLKTSQIYEPLRERAMLLDIDVSNAEMTKYIRGKLNKVGIDIPLKIKKEVFDFLVEIQDVYECINFGMLEKGILFRLSDETARKKDKKHKDIWKKSILQMLTRSDRK